jgi:hypothetical protein
MKVLVPTLLLSALVMAGCAAPGKMSEPMSANQCLAVGAAAATVCALTASNNRAGGAAMCGAAAFALCQIAASYQAKKLQSAQQIREEYKARGQMLPPEPTLSAFRSEVTPRVITRGSRVAVTSEFKVSPGRNTNQAVIEEEISVFDVAGEPLGKPHSKPFEGNEAGLFKTSFNISIPDKLSPGEYQVRRMIKINGKQVREFKDSFKVIQASNGKGIEVYALAQ